MRHPYGVPESIVPAISVPIGIPLVGEWPDGNRRALKRSGQILLTTVSVRIANDGWDGPTLTVTPICTSGH